MEQVIKTYKDEREMQRDSKKMTKNGFSIVSIGNVEGKKTILNQMRSINRGLAAVFISPLTLLVKKKSTSKTTVVWEKVN